MTMFAELAVRAQLAVGDLLADGSSPQDIDPSTGKGPEWGKAAPIGLLVIVLLCIAGYFLARSMSKHLRKVQQQADAARAAEHPEPDAGDDAPEAAEDEDEEGQEAEVARSAGGGEGAVRPD